MKTTILITGATATGKTEIALEVAKSLPKVEIISVDSRQIYRYMDIGTAKPNKSQRGECIHHMIDIINPDQRFSAGAFARATYNIINDIWNREGLPILVGGTGLYWQSAYDGLFADDEEYLEIRIKLQQKLDKEGVMSLYDELGRLDPIGQSRLAPSDSQRILRSLEVVHLKGKPLGDQWNKQVVAPLDCPSLMINLTMSRELLYQRIGQRVDSMLEQGLLQEVEDLQGLGYTRQSHAMGTLGYQEIMEFLEGRSSLDQASELIKQRTRNFAKRQITWCRRDRRLRELNIELWGKNGVVDRIVEGWEYMK